MYCITKLKMITGLYISKFSTVAEWKTTSLFYIPLNVFPGGTDRSA